MKKHSSPGENNVSKKVISYGRKKCRLFFNMFFSDEFRSYVLQPINEQYYDGFHQLILEKEIMNDDFELEMSPLCQKISSGGKTIQVDIYGDGKWILEIEDEHGNSTVWDAQPAN